MIGWFRYFNERGRESGVRLDHVVSWTIWRTKDGAAVERITLGLVTGFAAVVTRSSDVDALLMILERIEFTS